MKSEELELIEKKIVEKYGSRSKFCEEYLKTHKKNWPGRRNSIQNQLNKIKKLLDELDLEFEISRKINDDLGLW